MSGTGPLQRYRLYFPRPIFFNGFLFVLSLLIYYNRLKRNITGPQSVTYEYDCIQIDVMTFRLFIIGQSYDSEAMAFICVSFSFRFLADVY